MGGHRSRTRWSGVDAASAAMPIESGMSIHRCEVCAALMSPWEGNICLSCELHNSRWLSNADAAVFLLEKERHAVTTYDLMRGMHREFGRNTPKASLAAALSTDRRCCWAGRSMYGLYRHGLFPGPRNLAGIATIFLYSHKEPMQTDFLAFTMQYAGYRFRQASLRRALRCDANIVWEDWRGWVVRPRKEARARLRQLGFSPTFRGVDHAVQLCCAVIHDATAEHLRRLTGV